MKQIIQDFKKLIISTFSIVTAIVTVFRFFIGWEWEYILIVALGFLLLFCLLEICSLYKKNGPNYTPRDIPSLNESAYNRHPILIIDDDDCALRMIRVKLQEQGYDVAANRDLQDYRLATNFAIIISDIKGVGALDTAKALLERIKEKYPTKIIIPMSSMPCSIKVGESVIMKDDEDSYMEAIVEKVKQKQEELNSPGTYWKTISTKLPADKVDCCKRDFINYINALNGHE